MSPEGRLLEAWRRDEAWSLQLLMVAPEHRSQGHRATLALATGVRECGSAGQPPSSSEDCDQPGGLTSAGFVDFS